MSAQGKMAGNVLEKNAYMDGGYLEKNPTWFVEESPFKVRYILQMIEKNHLDPRTICEVGCGAGEVLSLLEKNMDPRCRFCGYEISPQAFQMCKARANERLQFRLADISQDDSAFFDLMLVLDVVEHVEDYFGFLSKIRPKADLKIFHFPLDLSVQAILRKRGLLKRRELYRHIQYFTKETTLATLEDVGYEVLDYSYTPRCIELAKELIQKVIRLPRQICFAMHQDLTARILGGYSLLVLAR